MILGPLTEQLQHLTRQGYPVEALLAVGNQWRGFLRGTVRLLACLDGMPDATDATASASADARRASEAALRGFVQGCGDALAAIYPAYREGLNRLYQTAQFWAMEVSRPRVGEAPRSLAALTDDALLDTMESKSRALVTEIRDAAGEIEAAMQKALDAARDQPDSLAEKRAVIDAGLDARDRVVRVYARANGLFRRVYELLRRLHEGHTAEVLDGRQVWSTDAEIGDYEL